MQGVSSLQPNVLPFRKFFTALVDSFGKEGLQPFILRNYEGFPESNVGNDIDFLIRKSDMPHIIRAVKSIDGIRIVGYSERTSVAHVFVQGVCTVPGSRALQLDFIWCLNWKGQEYLRLDEVLRMAKPRQAGDLNFLVPSTVHEAIISLLSSLLIGGWLKEKYFPEVQKTFADDRPAAIASLSQKFGVRTATRLVDSVIGGDRPKILGCVRLLRNSLALHSLRHRPFRGALAVVRYYAREFALRYSRRTLEKVCILGPAGCGNTAIIDELLPMLQHSAVRVDTIHSGPQLRAEEKPSEKSVSADSLVEARSSSLLSAAGIVQWLVHEWLTEYTKERNLTLRICDCRCYELLIAPSKRQYDGPACFARLVGRAFPSAVLWIFIGQDYAAMQTAKIARQLESLRSFVGKNGNLVVLDASKPAVSVTEDVYAVIIDTLEQRTDGILRNRYGFSS